MRKILFMRRGLEFPRRRHRLEHVPKKLKTFSIEDML
jgi:hypothetical protein